MIFLFPSGGIFSWWKAISKLSWYSRLPQLWVCYTPRKQTRNLEHEIPFESKSFKIISTRFHVNLSFFLLSLKYCRWQKSQTTTWIHLAYIKTCESWHKLPTPTGHCRISGPSTVSSGFSAILFRVTKAKRTAIEASLLNLSFQTTKEQWKKGPNGCFSGIIYRGWKSTQRNVGLIS